MQKPYSPGQHNNYNSKITQNHKEMTEGKNQIENSINDKPFLHHIYGFIFTSKDTVFKTSKTIQIKTLTQLISSKLTIASRELDNEKKKDKWV